MKRTIILAAIALIFGCNNPSNTKTGAGTSSNTQDSSTGNSAKTNSDATETGAEATEITVTLTGGANSGTYKATSNEATCSMGLTGAKSFGNQYSVSNKAPNELSSLQLIIDDYNAAKSGTDKFYIKVAFGKILEGNRYEINGGSSAMSMKKEGSGKATITESGGDKIVTIEGKTAAGVGISATIKCKKIITAG